ncbi:hypothetical protein FQR65_LT09759 [Abscondita terminalis]|nr:hypothetical protein FQR65_LT09759 [Abscondita terminalis]
MLKYLLLFVIGSSVAEINKCKDNFKCIPFNECEEIKSSIESNSLIDYILTFSCGYFHEPYICCARDCQTPNGNYGQLVTLGNCPSLKLDENSYTISKIEFLKDSFVNETHVCCHKNETTYRLVEPAPTEEAEFETDPFDWSCTTPNGESANCTHISDCPSYVEASVEPNEYFRFINDSFCGYWKQPMVCCGEVSHYQETYANNLPDANDCDVTPICLPNSQLPVLQELEIVGLKYSNRAIVSDKRINAITTFTDDCYFGTNLRYVYRNSPCTTPNSETGRCIPVKSCSVITNALENGSNEAIRFAQQSQCGYDSVPLVCCGTKGLQTDEVYSHRLLPNRNICGVESTNDRIVGGTNTDIDEFPWLALLQYVDDFGDDAGFRCGGTLINERYILTAAHCVIIYKNQGISLDSVRLGEWRISTEMDCDSLANNECTDPVVNVKVSNQILHPQYNGRTGKHDIALLRLAEPITFTDYIKPVCLPSADKSDPKIGERMIIAGWGQTEHGTTSDYKLRAELPIASRNLCSQKIRDRAPITEDQLCAGGEDGKDSCQGDSGGPLLAKFPEVINGRKQFYQEGVVAFEIGDKCLTPNGELAVCQSFSLCDNIFQAVLTLNESAVEFAKNSQCEGNAQPLICCGNATSLQPNSDFAENSLLANRSICGLDKEFDRIHGGQLTELNDFPWMVLLGYKMKHLDEISFKCGGTLINNRYVLTAAHCIRINPAIGISLHVVRLGEWNVTSEKDCTETGIYIECSNPIQDVLIEKQIAHAKYSRKSGDNDIGLLRLERNIEYTTYIQPICLPLNKMFTHDNNKKLTVSGWGATELGPRSEVKLKLDVPIIPNALCQQKLGKIANITDNHICAGGERGKDACQGDSGGPLMRYQETANKLQWIQEGIISWGVGCGRGSPCITPNKESATCTPVTSCNIIKDALTTQNETLIKFAQQSQCGYDTEPLVCCGTLAHATEPPYFSFFTKPPPTQKPFPGLDVISGNTLPNRTICGIEREDQRLIGATFAAIDEFPWMALIRYRDNENDDVGFKCGGTIINNRYVLTAAHCILTDPQPIKPIGVRLGEWRISTPEDCIEHIAILHCSDPVVDRKISQQIPHPYFNSRTGNNDIGLLRMDEDISYSDYIRPICLPPINLPPPPIGSIMTVCGWGATEDGSQADIKSKIEIPLVSNTECLKTVSSLTSITPNQVCAGGVEGKDACKGDSGGPLMRTYVDDTTQWYQEEPIEDCETPNGEKAKCVPIKSCLVITQAIAYLNPDSIEFAKKSQCGYEKDGPWVCCGSSGNKDVSTTTRKPQVLPVRTDRPDNVEPLGDMLLPDHTLCGYQLKLRDNRIVGGNISDIYEFPWMAALKYQQLDGSDGGFRCGGTLITKNHVLTAAQCLYIRGFKLVGVRLGEWRLSTEPDCIQDTESEQICADNVVDLKIIKTTPHPFYSIKSGNNDIALLTLEKNVKFTDFIRPICLPPADLAEPIPGTLLDISGWGITEKGSPSDYKLKVKIPMLSNEACRRVFTNYTHINPNQACAGGEEGKDACHGDSGGPLMTIFDKTNPDDDDQWFQEVTPSPNSSYYKATVTQKVKSQEKDRKDWNTGLWHESHGVSISTQDES